MAVKAGELESDLIDAVCRGVRERLHDGQAEAAEAFVRQYYHWVPAADLAGRTVDDLLGAALAHWGYAATRGEGEAKVRVLNPELGRDGFRSPHTVVQIVSDDMPFIVDSVTMELAHQGHAIELTIHPVIQVRRDASGHLVEVLPADAREPEAIPESVLMAEVRRENDPERVQELRTSMVRVLGEVRAAVEDWEAMRRRALELADERKSSPQPVADEEVKEDAAFLRWLADDHFTFLGYREYELSQGDAESTLTAQPDTGLGILRGAPAVPAKTLRGHAAELAHAPHLLVLTKANARATVHRPAHLDYIGVKRFGAGGQVTGECRFLGLYTTSAYRASPVEIPLLRVKVGEVLDRAGFAPISHDRKALLEILEAFPREAMLQIGTDDLFTTSMGLLRSRRAAAGAPLCVGRSV